MFYLLAILIHKTLTNYKPEELIRLEAKQNSTNEIIQDSVLSFVSWNVGYGGLGAECDFFYHGSNMYHSAGQMVRPPKDVVEKNVKGSVDFVEQNPTDFYLIQEVDYDSKRSYRIKQFDQIKDKLSEYAAYYATNLRSDRMPIPLMQPWKVYGKLESGLASYSKYQPTESIRYQLPGKYSWPVSLFQLDRCILLQRFKVKNGKELVILNIHNAAYDSDGSLKKQQMAFLKELVLAEYEKGNYLVIGGDWNQCPPYFQFDSFKLGDSEGYSQINIAPDFLPEDWRWVYDPTVPTNRKTDQIYDPLNTFVTLIDFYLISMRT